MSLVFAFTYMVPDWDNLLILSKRFVISMSIKPIYEHWFVRFLARGYHRLLFFSLLFFVVRTCQTINLDFYYRCEVCVECMSAHPQENRYPDWRLQILSIQMKLPIVSCETTRKKRPIIITDANISYDIISIVPMSVCKNAVSIPIVWANYVKIPC